MFRQALYFGINSNLDKKSKPEIFQLSEDKLKSIGLTGKYIAVYFFIKNGSIYLLSSHILKLSEEKKVEPKTIRSYTTIINYFKTNPNYSQYFLKSKAETSLFPMLNIRLRPSHHNLFHLAELILNKKFMLPGKKKKA